MSSVEKGETCQISFVKNTHPCEIGSVMKKFVFGFGSVSQFRIYINKHNSRNTIAGKIYSLFKTEKIY